MNIRKIKNIFNKGVHKCLNLFLYEQSYLKDFFFF